MSKKTLLLTSLLLAPGILACTSRAVDPRCEIHAPNQKYVGRLAQSINGSDLWQAYFDHVAPDESIARPLIAVNLEMERKITRPGGDGDYDPGKVRIRFRVTNRQNRAVLYTEDKSAELEPFMIGLFDENATREEIQNIAFEAAEDDVFPYLDRWLNIAALRAMAQLGPQGQALVPVLEAQAEDPWAEDLASEANHALAAIRGERR